MLAGLGFGCAHVQPGASVDQTPAVSAKLQVRNNAASLLEDLLDDEKNVDKVLIVKSAGKDVTALVKLIAATATTHKMELEQLATNDPTLNLKIMDLPPGEQTTRKSTAKSKEHDLLFSSGANFEFNLLSTQSEAENYGWHLAKVAAENSSSDTEKRTFEQISDSMRHLYEQTVKQMRALPAKPAN